MLRRSVFSFIAFVLTIGSFLLPPPRAYALTGFSTPLITNLTDVGATVTWQTTQQVFGGTINYGTTKSVALHTPENGIPGAVGDVHSVSLSALAPSTAYYYSVNLGGYTDDNGGSYYTFKTGPTLQSTPTPSNQVVMGKVLKADRLTPAVGVLVTLRVLDYYGFNTIPTSGVVSTLTTSGGSWTIALNNLRTSDASGPFTYPITGTNDIVQYSVSGGSLGDLALTPVQMIFTSNQLTVPNSILVQGLPTSTPTPITPTLSPTRSVTSALTPLAISTPSFTPIAVSPTIVHPTSAPTATQVPATATPPPPTDVPTATPVDTPTEVPTPMIPTDTPEPPTPTPSPTPPDTATVVPPSPSPAAPTVLSTPTVPTVASPWPTLIRMPLFASATVLENATSVPSPSPSPIATIVARPPAPVDSPGPQPTIALLTGLALVIAGIVVVTAGYVNQAHEN